MTRTGIAGAGGEIPKRCLGVREGLRLSRDVGLIDLQSARNPLGVGQQPRLDCPYGNTEAEGRWYVRHQAQQQGTGTDFGIEVTKHENQPARSRAGNEAAQAAVERILAARS